MTVSTALTRPEDSTITSGSAINLQVTAKWASYKRVTTETASLFR